MKNAFLKLAGILILLLQMSCGYKEAKITSTGTAIILEGHYNGNNLYLKNPVGSDGLGRWMLRAEHALAALQRAAVERQGSGRVAATREEATGVVQ